jgi:phosphate transport system permease protein
MTTTTSQPRTTVVGTDRSAPVEARRNISTVRRSDVLALFGAGAAAFSITGVLFTELAPLSGPVGFVVVTYAVFIVLYAALVSIDENKSAVVDRLAAVFVQSLAFLVFLALAGIILYVVSRGAGALRHPNFFTSDMQKAGPLEPLSVGGIKHAMIGSVEQISIALLITIPMGLICAVFLNEVRGGFSRFVRTIVEAMTALPSIVAGLFIYAAYILAFGNATVTIFGYHVLVHGDAVVFGHRLHAGKSGFAASLALSVMMLPIIIRAADVVLRLVPGSLKEASLALGAGQWRTTWHVVLPTARSGLTTAVILGTARGIGETSPVLLTAGFTAAANYDPFNGPQVSLPLMIFSFVRSSQDTMKQRGFGAAVVLLSLVLILFILARIAGGRAPGDLTRRQEHRRVLASRRDLSRFEQRTARFDPVAGPDLQIVWPPT